MSEWYRNVEIAKTRADLLGVCRLRYSVYVDELKRDNYAHLNNTQRILEDPLDHEDGVVNLFVRAPGDDADADADGGLLAGCARIHVPLPETYHDMFGIGHADLFPGAAGPDDFAFFSRFMVAAEFRGRNGATESIYERCYVQARQMGAKYLLLNCSPSLATVYENRGWVRYKHTYWDGNMGMTLPMCLPIADTAFLGSLGTFSIIPVKLRAAPSGSGDGGPEGVPKGEWLTHTLTRLEAPLVSSRFCTPAIIQNFILERISLEEMNQVPLFYDTTSPERMAFLKSAGGYVPFIRVKAGDSISLVGEVRDEAFLVLSGRVRAEYGETLLGFAGAGALIGEKAFLSGAKRAMAVRAEEDVELLVISRITFKKAMVKSPDVAVKFLFNVACSLSRSYSDNMARMHSEIEALHKAAPAQPSQEATVDGDGRWSVLSPNASEMMRDSVLSTHNDDDCGEVTGDKISLVAKVVEEGAAMLFRMSKLDMKATLNWSHKNRTKKCSLLNYN
eukprot:CAMPEP_0194265562 /NCGR_PEP_ID=MMETSP0169-20130528/759_1 /TAXON_ID=218684 /ORGANISM="Corethron pennatum, Strain L29A3" /LENGTH=503 /DNA_ID=CAMNT_0039006049 /DNA_START=130 /DNA_END=1641 /DNA_ORIENTATION=-